MGDGVRVRGCFKFGCFGCLGVGAAAVLVVAALIAAATLQATKEPVPQRHAASHPLPGAQPGAVEAPQPADAPSRPAAPPGRVVVNLRAGSFRILPAQPGEPLRVDADFDANRFVLKEGFEADVEGAAGWTYHLTFRPRGLGIHVGESLDPELRLYLPAGAPIALEGYIGMGESETELGGLWITSTDLRLGMGEHDVSFAEPLPVPMDRFEVASSMGELGILSLGNASPRHARVTHRMGQMLLDLRGAWVRDAAIEGRCSMGEFRVRAPRGVRFETGDVSVWLGEKSVAVSGAAEPLPPGAPTVRLSASASLGELRVN